MPIDDIICSLLFFQQVRYLQRLQWLSIETTFLYHFYSTLFTALYSYTSPDIYLPLYSSKRCSQMNQKKHILNNRFLIQHAPGKYFYLTVFILYFLLSAIANSRLNRW